MFITPDELKTHLYKENIRLIQGDDDTILLSAIEGAEEEAAGYLAKYDRKEIFAQQDSRRHPLLLIFLKDIAVWHFITLCNAGADLDFRRFRYERAISWLKAVQKGDVSPSLPLLDADGDGHADNPEYLYGSNPKRDNHY